MISSLSNTTHLIDRRAGKPTQVHQNSYLCSYRTLLFLRGRDLWRLNKSLLFLCSSNLHIKKLKREWVNEHQSPGLLFFFAPQGNTATSDKRSIFAQDIAARRLCEARVPPLREVVSALDPPEGELGLKRLRLGLFVIHDHRVIYIVGYMYFCLKYKVHLSYLKRKLLHIPT